MKIDKIDIVRSANDMEKIIMDVYDQKARYMFLTSGILFMISYLMHKPEK